MHVAASSIRKERAIVILTVLALLFSLVAVFAPPASADHIDPTGPVGSHCVEFQAGETGTASPPDYPNVSITLDSWDDTPQDPHEVTFTISGLAGYQQVEVSAKSGQAVEEDGPYFNGTHTIVSLEQNAISHVRLCVFIGEYGKLHIKKEVTEGSDTTVVFTFDSTSTDDEILLAHGDEYIEDVTPGTYAVSETVPDGWELQSATCESTDEADDSTPAAINVSANEVVTCTFVNDELPPEPGRIIVEKEVTEGSDTEQSFQFTASYDGDGFSLADGDSNDSGNLAPGTYSVSETVPAGWSLESATCDDESDPSAISLQEGETVTCTFVNDELPPEVGRIVVEKVVTLGDQTQAFTFVTTGFELDDNTLAHGESSSSGDLAPGSYAVSETLPVEGDWSLDSAVCDNGDDPSDITLAEGEVVTCTFTNSQPEVLASVLVTVEGSCITNDDGSGTGTVSVVVSVDGGATVVIKSGSDTIATFTEDGSVEVPIGQTYTWEATPNEGFEFPPGFVSSGTVEVIDCTEVLPFTGIDTERLLGLSILLLGSGAMLVIASRRREEG